MKNICLLLFVVSVLSSCTWMQNKKSVLSKYHNDTLYTQTINNENYSVSISIVNAEKTYKPGRDEIVKKALVSKKTADEWLRIGTSDGTNVATITKTTIIGKIFRVIGIIILLFFAVIGFMFMTSGGGRIYNA